MKTRQTIDSLGHLLAIELEYKGFTSRSTPRVGIRCTRLQSRSRRVFVPIEDNDHSWVQQAVNWLNERGVWIDSFCCIGCDKYILHARFSECDLLQKALLNQEKQEVAE